MAGSTDLLVRILGDTSSLNKALNETNSKLGSFGSVAKKAAGAFVAGFAADQVIDFLGDATKAAEEDKKSQALLANQLRETNKATDAQIAAVEDSIDVLARQSGVADDSLRPAFAALARSTGDTKVAQEQLAIAMDIAAARGIDLETVTTAMEKANNGNVGALGRLGVATKDAEGNTLSLTEVMAGAQKTYEGAAEAAVTPSERMSIAWGELKEQIGTVLLPALEKVSTWAAETLLPAMQDAIAWVQENWPEIQKTITDVFQKVKPWIDEFVHTIELAWNTISGIFKTFNALLHGDFSKAWEEFKNLIGDVWDGIVKLVGDKVEQMKVLFGGLVEWVKGLPGMLADAARGMWDFVYDAWKFIPNKIIDLFNKLLDRIGIHIHIDPPGPGSINFDWDAPKIPHLATGGIVRRPTLAVVGEAGPEAVVPLSRGGGMAGGTVNITINTLDPRTAGDAVVAALSDYGRRNNGVRIPGGVVAVS